MRNWLDKARQKVSRKSFFHLHLISDSTGETLSTTARAVAAQYGKWRAIEHVTPMVRKRQQLEKALDAVDGAPGIVLYTLVDEEFVGLVESRCQKMGVPSLNLLLPITRVFDTYLGDSKSGRTGAQHTLDDEYFGRLDAVRYAMTHDDGNLPDDLEEVDIILVGISRTSKTPTSIYLAQRGTKVINIPLVPGIDVPASVYEANNPLIVALVASAERILQVRENRLLAFGQELNDASYVDRASIMEELAWTRRLCKQNGWPMIDVSKRSIEETSAAILALRRNRD